MGPDHTNCIKPQYRSTTWPPRRVTRPCTHTRKNGKGSNDMQRWNDGCRIESTMGTSKEHGDYRWWGNRWKYDQTQEILPQKNTTLSGIGTSKCYKWHLRNYRIHAYIESISGKEISEEEPKTSLTNLRRVNRWCWGYSNRLLILNTNPYLDFNAHINAKNDK